MQKELTFGRFCRFSCTAVSTIQVQSEALLSPFKSFLVFWLLLQFSHQPVEVWFVHYTVYSYHVSPRIMLKLCNPQRRALEHLNQHIISAYHYFIYGVSGQNNRLYLFSLFISESKIIRGRTDNKGFDGCFCRGL